LNKQLKNQLNACRVYQSSEKKPLKILSNCECEKLIAEPKELIRITRSNYCIVFKASQVILDSIEDFSTNHKNWGRRYDEKERT